MANFTSNLDQITTAQSLKEARINALIDAGSPSTSFGRRESTSAGRTFGIYGGVVFYNGSFQTVSNATLSLTANATNYIQINPKNLLLNFNTIGFTPGHIALYEVVTNATTITNYTDRRSFYKVDNNIYTASVTTTGGPVSLTYTQSLANVIEVSGTLTSDVTLSIPQFNKKYFIVNKTNGPFALFVEAGGNQVLVRQSEAEYVFVNGTSINYKDVKNKLTKIEVPLTSGTVILNENQYSQNILVLTGVLTSDVFIELPDEPRKYFFENETTGPFSVFIYNTATPLDSHELKQNEAGFFVANTGELYDIREKNRVNVLTLDISGGSLTLTPQQARNKVIRIIGTPAADTTITFPGEEREYIIENLENSNHVITLTVAGGTPVVSARDTRAIYYTDATNIYRVTAENPV